MSEPTRAWRNWKYDFSTNRLIGRHFTTWESGTMRAACLYSDNPSPHEVAVEHIEKGVCDCGIYGVWEPFFEKKGNWYANELVGGLVTMWGAAQFGDYGIKAEYARIEQLWAPAPLIPFLRQTYPEVVVVSWDEPLPPPLAMPDPVNYELLWERKDTPPVVVVRHWKPRLPGLPRSKSMTSHVYRALRLLEFSVEPLTSGQIGNVLGLKPLPSDPRRFTGLSSLMANLTRRNCSRDPVEGWAIYSEPRVLVENPDSTPFRYSIAPIGIAYLREVEARDKERRRKATLKAKRARNDAQKS